MNFLELVKARYSARKYANRPVEAEKLDYIMECVRFAPSAVNFQPWRFRIVNKVAPEETPKKAPAVAPTADTGAMDAIKAAVEILTAGKGQVIKIEKL